MLFECFAYFDQNQINPQNLKGKNNSNSRPKNIQADPDFSRLIKALINILECEPEGKSNRFSASSENEMDSMSLQNKIKGRDITKNDQTRNRFLLNNFKKMIRIFLQIIFKYSNI